MMLQLSYERRSTVRDIASIVFKHKRKMIFTFGATVLVVAICSLLITPVYRSSSKLLLKFGRENIYMPAVAGASSSPPVLVDPMGTERINAAIEMIKGQKVIMGVFEKMGVKNVYPNLVGNETPSAMQSTLNNAVRLFQRNLSVQGIKKSNLVEIRFDHNDPNTAAKVVNTLIDTFVEYHVTTYREPRDYDFFSQQVKLLAEKLKRSESELAAFRERHSISSLQDQKTTLLKQISEIEIDLSKAKADLAEKKGKKVALENSHDSLTAEPRFGKETDYNLQAMATIRAKLTELQLREAELLNRYPETNTLVLNARKEVEQAQRHLAREEKTYNEKEVNTLGHNVQALKQRETVIKEALAASQRKLNGLAAAETKFTELERQFKLNEENYRLYMTKMEESRISNAMDMEKIANLSVVEPPSVPVSPTRPKFLFNTILSIILGCFLSLLAVVLAEHLGHTFAKAEDVEKHLGVPIVASITEGEV